MSPQVVSPSASIAYTALHRAFTDHARAWHMRPVEMRILLAVFEGYHTTEQLERGLRLNGSQVRRAIGPLRGLNLVDASAADGTPQPKRGVRTKLALTPRGAKVARDILQAVTVPQPMYATNT